MNILRTSCPLPRIAASLASSTSCWLCEAETSALAATTLASLSARAVYRPELQENKMAQTKCKNPECNTDNPEQDRLILNQDETGQENGGRVKRSTERRKV